VIGISKEMDFAVARVSPLKGNLLLIFKFSTLTSALGKLLIRLKLISSKLNFENFLHNNLLCVLE